MRGKMIDTRDHVYQVKISVHAFYEAYYAGNRLKLYSYLDTDFQQSVPLNYFLIHSDYDIDLGYLKNITRIEVTKDKNYALAETCIQLLNKTIEVPFTLKIDYGGWKIDGDIYDLFAKIIPI